MRFRPAHIIAALVLCAPSLSSPVMAVTTTTTFLVSATVLKSCSVAALPLAFGNYDPTAAAALNMTTTLTILCTTGTSYTVGLTAGTTTGATVTSRKMTNGTQNLDYALYQDSARTTNWGNTPGTDTPVAVVATALPATPTVYGQIPAGQNVPLGLYTDTVTVNLNY